MGQDRNVILTGTHEYRQPEPSSIAAVAATSNATADGNNAVAAIRLDMTSRFLGLVVVPGKHITKIEIEEKPLTTVVG